LVKVLTSLPAQMISQYALMEQNMNAAERILVYTELPKEGIREKPSDPAPSAWPKGSINFIDASLAYRKGLPLVLKSVSFSIQQGEKIGVVGRTGAGEHTHMSLPNFINTVCHRQELATSGTVQDRRTSVWEDRNRRRRYLNHWLRYLETWACVSTPRSCPFPRNSQGKFVSTFLPLARS
jgi:ABC-type transport system involved in cytochrome bd biosynthesis fused ATPase/permease subunit